MIYIFQNCLHSFLWRKIFDHFSLSIYEKFSEVPGHHTRCFWFRVKKLTIAPKINIKRMSVFSIDFDFLENWEGRVELIWNKFLYFFWSSWFLIIELVARHCDNLKSFIFPLLMCLGHLFIVRRCESSLTSNIDYHGQFIHPELIKSKFISFDIFHCNAEDILIAQWLIQVLFVLFPDQAVEEPTNACH